MRIKIIKFLIKLLGLDTSEAYGLVDKTKIEKWLYMSYKDDGWKNYNTLRKKSLLSLLSLGTGYNNEYWEIVGRIKELQSLSSNITKEKERREKLAKKQNIKK